METTLLCSELVTLVMTIGFLGVGADPSNQCTAELTVDKVVYAVNDTLLATCAIISTEASPCDLTSESLSLLTPQNQSYQPEIVDSTTARFTLRSLSIKNSGQIRCVDEHDRQLDQTTITVGVVPIKPFNVQCLVNNLNSMICSWEPEKQSTGGVITTTQLYYATAFRPVTEADKRCPEQTYNQCRWSEDNRTFIRNNYYGVVVEAKNDLGTVRSDLHAFHSSDFVKLNKVKDLKADHSGKTFIELSWVEPVYEYYLLHILYFIHVESKWQEQPQDIKVGPYEMNRVPYNLTRLVPHTHYTVTVTAITNQTWHAQRQHTQEFLSDPVSQIFKTESDVPAKAPVVTEGGFLLKGTQVTIHWQPVAPIHVQGEFSETRVRYTRRTAPSDPSSCDSEDVGDANEVTVKDQKVYSVMLDLAVNATYDVCVDIANEVGHNNALVLQPVRINTANLCDSPTFYVMKDGDHLMVHLLDVYESHRYTLFWCSGFIGRGKCNEEPYSWRQITQNPTSLTDVSLTNTIVGVSTECTNSSMTLSSGITLAPYIFDAKNTIQSPSNIKILPDKSSARKGLSVEWNKPKFSETRFIRRFQIAYCQLDLCKEQQVTVLDVPLLGILHGEMQTQYLSGLIPGETYEVSMRSVGDNETSEYTHPTKGTVPVYGLQAWHIGLISLAALICLGLVVAALYTIIKKCKKRIEAYLAPMPIVEIPDLTDEYRDKTEGTDGIPDPYVDIDPSKSRATYWTGESIQKDVADIVTAPSDPSLNDFLDSNKNDDHHKPEEDSLDKFLLDSNANCSSNASSGQPLLQGHIT